MRRRKLLLLLGASSLPPRFAGAQQRRLIGVLWMDMPGITKEDAALRQGLAEHRLVEGPNLTFAARYAEGDLTRFPALADELAALKPDVIVASGSTAALAAHRAAPDVPIAAVFDGDPVAQGLFQSYARPEGMVTGLSLTASNEQIGKNFEILRDLMPGLRGVGFMFVPEVVGAVQLEPTASAVAKDLGLAYVAFPVRSMDEVKAAFSSREVGAMSIYGSSLLRKNLTAFVDLAIAAKKPVITIFRGFTERGFLVSHGPDLLDIWRRIGGYAAKFLAGTKPSDLPVEMPSKLAFVINLKTAKSLGLTIPPLILARADEVIE
jgi:putative tryptophan/tyrosine transport system substrate-binding protein